MGLFKTCPRISLSFQKERISFSLEVNLVAKRSQFPAQPTGEAAEQRRTPPAEKGAICGLCITDTGIWQNTLEKAPSLVIIDMALVLSNLNFEPLQI